MKRKTKLQMAQEEEKNEDAEEIQRMVEAMTRSSVEKYQKFLVLPIVYIFAMLVRMIPDFTRTLYLSASSYDQPFTAYFVSKLPGPSQFLAPIIYVLVAYYIIISRGSIITAALTAIQLICTEVTYSYASQNIVVTICLISMMISLVLSHYLLEYDPYSMVWFMIYASSMMFAFLTLYVSINYAGFTVASYIACFISSFSRFGAVKNSKARLIIESFLLLLTSYIVVFPLMLALIKIHDSEDANTYQKYTIRYSDYMNEMRRMPTPFEYISIFISMMVLRFGRYRYVNVVPLIQIFAGVIATIYIPYETPGEAVASRLFIIRTLLMIWSGIVFSASKYNLIKYGVPALMCVLTISFRLFNFFSQ